MPLTAQERKRATKQWILRMFVQSGATATFSQDHLLQVIGAIDDFFVASIGTLNDAQTVEQALNQALPTPFRGAATLQQKALAVAYWAMQRGGLLPNED